PPAIGAAARMVVGQVLPSGAVGAIILADGTPLALGEVGSPALPIRFVLAILFQSNFFFSHALLSLLFFRRFYFIIPSIHDGGLFETISKGAAPTLRYSLHCRGTAHSCYIICIACVEPVLDGNNFHSWSRSFRRYFRTCRCD